MDRWHEGWARSCWVAAACLVVACGGRSGELYYDDVSTGNGGSGGSDNFGGAGGSLSLGGAGGSDSSGGTGGGFGTGGVAGDMGFGGAGGSDAAGGSSNFGGTAGDGGSDNFGGAGGSDNTGGSSNFGGTGGTDGTGTTSGPLECLGCLAQSCPFLVKCAQDVTCYQRVLCTVRDCFDDAPSLECLLRCHDGDVAAALEFAGALACAAQTCGDRCNFEQ